MAVTRELLVLAAGLSQADVLAAAGQGSGPGPGLRGPPGLMSEAPQARRARASLFA